MPSVEQLFEEAEASVVEMPAEREAVDLGNGITGESWVRRPDGTSNREVPVYDTKTGVETRILPYMIPGVMRMAREDGTRRYSRTQDVTPAKGTIACLLHPDSPDHSDAIESGVTGVECKRGPDMGLMSAFDLENHMRYIHPKEYATIEKFRRSRIEQEQREFQRMQMQVMQQQLGGKRSGTS